LETEINCTGGKDVGYVSLLSAYVPLIFIFEDSGLLEHGAVLLGLWFFYVVKEHTNILLASKNSSWIPTTLEGEGTTLL